MILNLKEKRSRRAFYTALILFLSGGFAFGLVFGFTIASSGRLFIIGLIYALPFAILEYISLIIWLKIWRER